MEIELSIDVKIICDCGSKLKADVRGRAGSQEIVVYPCESCMDAAAEEAT